LGRTVFFFELTVIHSPSSLLEFDFCKPFDCLCLVAAAFAGGLAFLSTLLAVRTAFLSLVFLLLAVLLEDGALVGDSFFVELGLDVAFFDGLFLTGLCCLLGDDRAEFLDLDGEPLSEDCDDLNKNMYKSPRVEPTASTTAMSP
jgi:hypothetical protein